MASSSGFGLHLQKVKANSEGIKSLTFCPSSQKCILTYSVVSAGLFMVITSIVYFRFGAFLH